VKQTLIAALLSATATVAYAQQADVEVLTSALPAPLDGWSRADSPDQDGMAAFFGGSFAQQVYTGPSSEFLLMMMTGNRMGETLARQFDDPAELATLGPVTEVDGFAFVQQGDQITGAVGAIIVQSTGQAMPQDVYSHLEMVDLSELAEMFP
jgi:hypothetical protein